jgi:hypothetical protein
MFSELAQRCIARDGDLGGDTAEHDGYTCQGEDRVDRSDVHTEDVAVESVQR